ncbi:MAG: hypothetical protein HY326_09990, partial [Chloroflexi bacterium]|nr:hypothetical protein [Chloroflexota bacterium]
AAADDGRIYAGPNGGAWQNVFSHPASAGITDLEVDLDNPAIVYASFGGTGNNRIFRLQRSSPTPATMAALDITSDLPMGLTVNTIGVDRMNPLTVYAGTSQGVYPGRSVNGGITWSWQLYNNGMPLANVTDLEVHPITGVMRAGTYGRGAFEVNTDFPIGVLVTTEGRITYLRVHDVGSGYGTPTDNLDAEAIILLDGEPYKSFGFQLRTDANRLAHKGMLDTLRDVFNQNRRVQIDYVRTGLRTGRITRMLEIP